MRRRLIRLALLSYPSPWRRRYGDEFEQLMLDCAAGATLLSSAWQLIGAGGSGISERVRRIGPRSRALSVVCVCATAGSVIDAEAVSATDVVIPAMPSAMVWLAPDAFLPANAIIAHAPADEFPASSAALPRRTTIQLAPGSSRVIGVSGPPVTIVLNPKNDEITAIRPGA